MNVLIDASSVSVRLGQRDVLHHVSLAVPSGSLTIVIGPNGAGKSTLLRAFSGELRPASGYVSLKGRDLRAFHPLELAASRAVMPQAAALAFPFRVEEVVGLGASVPAFNTSRASCAIVEAMELADVAQFCGRDYTRLSGGERQRVQFARALCQLIAGRTPPEETVLLLDEPTSSLDLPHQMHLMACAHAESRKGRTVIAVLHDLNLAATWADQIVALGDGKVHSVGTAPDVLTSSQLSKLYGCPIEISPSGDEAVPAILPQAMRRRTTSAGAPDSLDVDRSRPTCSMLNETKTAQPAESQPCD
jgi:iron complex transport system ATP-binding protein